VALMEKGLVGLLPYLVLVFFATLSGAEGPSPGRSLSSRSPER
jgi:hypothetical protein